MSHTCAKPTSITWRKKTDATNKLLADLLESNVWFTTKITDAVEKKFQSIVHHHENVVKLAQHHRLAPGALPHDVLDEPHLVCSQEKEHGLLRELCFRPHSGGGFPPV